MLHAGVLVCPAAAPRRTLTVIITLQAHQLPMAKIVDGDAVKGIQCNYNEQFGDRVKELLDPANGPPPKCPPPILEESGKVRIYKYFCFAK